MLLIDILLLIGLNVSMRYYSGLVWFSNFGYADRFWTVVGTRLILFGVGAGLSFAVAYATTGWMGTAGRSRGSTYVRLGAALVLAVTMGLMAAGMWHEYLLLTNGVDPQLSEPVLGQSVGFCLFSLPFLSGLGLFIRWGNTERTGSPGDPSARADRAPLFVFSSLALFSLSFNTILGIFRLLCSQAGVVRGAGWLHANVRIMARVISAAVLTGSGVVLLVGITSDKLLHGIFGARISEETGKLHLSARALIAPSAVITILILVQTVIPGLVGATVVKPNEITRERPCLEHNIRFTRVAYRLEDSRIDNRRFGVGRNVTKEVLDGNQSPLDNIRLWGQRGSEVIRGNLLAIPLFHNGVLYLLFVEPIFLQAEDAQLPEIKRVALADQVRVVWSEQFETSLEALTGDETKTQVTAAEIAAETGPSVAPGTLDELAQRAADLFSRVEEAFSAGRYEQAGASLEELSRLYGENPAV